MIVSSSTTKPAWVDPDDAPELDEAWFQRADLMIGDKTVRPGRPRGSSKTMVSLRLDSDLVAQWRATGPGWQTRINEALRKARVA